MRMQLSLNKCHGQCYDGAANMLGCLNGLHTRISEVEKRALYVQCRARKLNLAVQDAMSNNKNVRDVMVLVQELTSFIRGSPKWLAWFSHFQNEYAQNQTKTLRRFCPTRWTKQLVSLQAITSNYNAILEWLQEVDNNDKTATTVKAGGYRRSLTSFDTFFFLEVLRTVFTIIQGGNTSLQGKQLNFSKAEQVIKAIQ